MDDREVIVYIDENTDDGMMWEELNQTGQMQVEVYDEEWNNWVEYHHTIKVKSLQEYLADHDKQIRKEVVQEIREIADLDDWEEINGYTLEKILDRIEGVDE